MANNVIGQQDLQNELYLKELLEGIGQATETSLGLVKAISLTPQHVNLVAIDDATGLLWSIGSSEVDLTNYFTKDETYSRGEIDTLINNIDSLTSDDVYFKFEVYNKTEIDDLLSGLEPDTSLLVTSVNGETGDVILTTNNITTESGGTLQSLFDTIEDDITNIENNLSLDFIKSKGVLQTADDLPSPESSEEGWLYGIVDNDTLIPVLFIGGEWKGLYKEYDLDFYALKTEVYSKDEMDVILQEVGKVDSVNGKLPDVDKNIELYGTDLKIEEGGEQNIKEYIDNLDFGTGGENVIQYADLDVTRYTLRVGQSASGVLDLDSVVPIGGRLIGELIGDTIVLNRDYDVIDINASVYWDNASNSNFYIQVNGVAVSGHKNYSSTWSETAVTLANLKEGDFIKVYMSAISGSIKLIDNLIPNITLKGWNVKTSSIADVVEKVSRTSTQIFLVENQNATSLGGAWHDVPMQYLSGNARNTMLPSDFASLDLEGNIVLNNDFSLNVNYISLKGTFFGNGSNDIYFRFILSPPGATDIYNDKSDLNQSRFLGESGSTKAGSRDVINLTTRDIVAIDESGQDVGGWTVRCQLFSSTGITIESVGIDFNVYTI